MKRRDFLKTAAAAGAAAALGTGSLSLASCVLSCEKPTQGMVVQPPTKPSGGSERKKPAFSGRLIYDG